MTERSNSRSTSRRLFFDEIGWPLEVAAQAESRGATGQVGSQSHHVIAAWEAAKLDDASELKFPNFLTKSRLGVREWNCSQFLTKSRKCEDSYFDYPGNISHVMPDDKTVITTKVCQRIRQILPKPFLKTTKSEQSDANKKFPKFFSPDLNDELSDANERSLVVISWV